MIVYVDESYADNQEKIILGALFVGVAEHKRLTARIREIKHNAKFAGEIKYSQINDNTRFQVARKMAAAFFASENAYFCACIIPYSATKLEKFEGVDTNQKRVNIYTDSAKKLILGNLPINSTSNIYFDQEDRIKKTKLFPKLKKSKSVNGSKIAEVYFTKSDDESRCVLQICDILTGAIKQNLYPSNTEKSKFKRKYSSLVLKTAGIKGCKEEFWRNGSKGKNHKIHQKFYISYFKIPKYTPPESKEPQLVRSSEIR